MLIETTYTVNEAGATSLRDARPMTFGLNRYVTANVAGDTVSVFVGLKMHYDGPMPAGMTAGSPEFYAWVREVATEGEAKANALPPMPKASDFTGEDLKAFKRGRAAAQRYYRRMNAGYDTDYCAIVERADARNERGAWYDGFDSICNPEYFAA